MMRAMSWLLSWRNGTSSAAYPTWQGWVEVDEARGRIFVLIANPDQEPTRMGYPA